MPSRPGHRMTELRGWLVDAALPFWLDRGFCRSAACFRERLGFDRAPARVPQRTMVQARQIFVFAEAARLGWIDPGSAPERAMHALVASSAERAGGSASFAFSRHEEGGVASPVRDAYAHAFVLLALASLYALTGDQQWRRLADEVTTFVEGALVDPCHGGLFDCLPEAPALKRQNPAMHLLEAYLAWERVAPGAGYLERAADLAALFRHRLFKPEQKALLEYFSPDWTDHDDPALGRHFEPGHHFEWVWLLDEYDRLSGECTTGKHLLFDAARASGLSAGGAVFDRVDAASRQPGGGHRLWPHTEGIKAALVRCDEGDAAAPAFIERMAATLLDTFLDRPFPGGWIDHVDADGKPLVDYVPASSLYHIALCVFEHDRRRGAWDPWQSNQILQRPVAAMAGTSAHA